MLGADGLPGFSGASFAAGLRFVHTHGSGSTDGHVSGVTACRLPRTAEGTIICRDPRPVVAEGTARRYPCSLALVSGCVGGAGEAAPAGIEGGSACGRHTLQLPTGKQASKVEVRFEGRSLTVDAAGRFTDDFAAEHTHHIYKLSCGWIRRSPWWCSRRGRYHGSRSVGVCELVEPDA